MNLSALPDNPASVAPPWTLPGETYSERRTVTEEQAVAAVLDCLTSREPFAYGEKAEWWLDVLNDYVARQQPDCFVALIAPNQFGSNNSSVRAFLHAAIGKEANRLLEQDYGLVLDQMFGGDV